jgi:hypothetical protein
MAGFYITQLNIKLELKKAAGQQNNFHDWHISVSTTTATESIQISK